MRLFLIFGLVACGDKDTVTDDSTTTGDDSQATGDDSTPTDDSDTPALVSDAAGNIDLRDGTLTAQVDIAHAFSFYSSASTFVYAVSNPDTTCSDVVEYFTRDKTAFDRSRLFKDGYCNLSFTWQGQPDLSSYDLQVDSGAVVSAACPYGEGSWTYDSTASFPDYYWTGEYYEASAWKGTFSLTLTKAEGKDITSVVELREWDGHFPYESDRPGNYKASGKIVGTIYATHCEGLEETGWF